VPREGDRQLGLAVPVHGRSSTPLFVDRSIHKDLPIPGARGADVLDVDADDRGAIARQLVIPLCSLVGLVGGPFPGLPQSCDKDRRLQGGNWSATARCRAPTLCCYYYKSSRIKQYFKEGRALRTETVICDTQDFGIGRRVCATNWNALRAVGESANRRLCDAESADALPAPDVVTFHQVTRPSNSEDGLYTPPLRFGDPRVMAVLASLVGFCHLVEGFSNRQLLQYTTALLDALYATRQATYDLRRLKRKGLILKTPHSHRYQLTPLGRSQKSATRLDCTLNARLPLVKPFIVR
jgi:hypothetical protein